MIIYTHIVIYGNGRQRRKGKKTSCTLHHSDITRSTMVGTWYQVSIGNRTGIHSTSLVAYLGFLRGTFHPLKGITPRTRPSSHVPEYDYFHIPAIGKGGHPSTPLAQLLLLVCVMNMQYFKYGLLKDKIILIKSFSE